MSARPARIFRSLAQAGMALACALACLCAPACGASVADGVYEADVQTDSSMVHVVYCTVEVQDGAMQATMALHGQGFSRLYLGSADDAAEADDVDIYDYVLDDEGWYTFTFPLAQTDADVELALFGQRRDRWYDHTLVFTLGDALQGDEGGEAGQDDAETVALDELEDGSYTVEVTLEGGTGKASIASPVQLSIEQGAMTATLVWSSTNYDLMVVDGCEYEPVTLEGGSTFQIPVASLEEPLDVQGETTAMSEPHLIDYTLTFDTATIRRA